jgi:hypothetical protein
MGRSTDKEVVRAVEMLYKDFSVKELARLFGLPLRTMYDLVNRAKRKAEDFFPWDEIDVDSLAVESYGREFSNALDSVSEALSAVFMAIQRIDGRLETVERVLLALSARREGNAPRLASSRGRYVY